jgi:hypothetical protein
MEYLYLQLDQIFSRNSFHAKSDLAVIRPSSPGVLVTASALAGHPRFAIRRLVRKPILPRPSDAAISAGLVRDRW